MKGKFLAIMLSSTVLFACSGSKNDQEKLNKPNGQSSSLQSSSLESVKSLSSTSFVPDRVFFDFDNYKVDGKYSQDLKSQAEYLKEQLKVNANQSIVVEGNCDERGGVEYNMALGKKRAQAAKDFLVAQGIPANKIKTVSFGKERKLVEGTSAVAYLQNRAAVTVVNSKK